MSKKNKQQQAPGVSDDPAAIFEAAFQLHQQGNLVEAAKLYRRVLNVAPNNFDTLHLLGVIHLQTNKPQLAAQMIAKAVESDPTSASAFSNLGLAYQELGQLPQALQSFERAIALNPRHVSSIFNRAIVLNTQERHEEAIAGFQTALQLEAKFFDAQMGLGQAFIKLKKFEEALASFEAALKINPKSFECLIDIGKMHLELKQNDEALAAFDQAIALNPKSEKAYANRALALRQLSRPEEALESCETAIKLNPRFEEAWLNRGVIETELGKTDAAIATYEKLLQLNPKHASAHSNLGFAYGAKGRVIKASEHFDRALMVKPNLVEAQMGLVTVLPQIGHHQEALTWIEKVIKKDPKRADAHINRGIILEQMKDYEGAIGSFEKGLELNDGYFPFAPGYLLMARQMISAWDKFDSLKAEIAAGIEAKKFMVQRFNTMVCLNSRAHQCAVMKLLGDELTSLKKVVPFKKKADANAKIRVAFISADFREHPVTYLLLPVLRAHDRNKFEFYALSLHPGQSDEMLENIRSSVHRFIDVTETNEVAIAKFCRDLEIDICVDLMGETANGRPKIFAYRAAPIQINYLGFAGSMGSDVFDYIIGDRVVTPLDHADSYAERILSLPNSYLPTHMARPVWTGTHSRADYDLPEKAFVFCAFNNTYKITPDVFAIWMRVLAKVEGSVLWLAGTNGLSMNNMRKEAEAFGIAPERLIFAKRLDDIGQHLARYKLADLFLDTLPYNAHTTASDALWAGLPVITELGEFFVSRVAASLLTTLGMPELIAKSHADYEALALDLALNPAKLKAIREKLGQNINKMPLFNTETYTRNLEKAFKAAYDRFQAGLEPDHILIEG